MSTLTALTYARFSDFISLALLCGMSQHAALLRKRTLHVSGFEITLQQEELRTVLVSFDLEDKAVNAAAMEHFSSALIRVKRCVCRVCVPNRGQGE